MHFKFVKTKDVKSPERWFVTSSWTDFYIPSSWLDGNVKITPLEHWSEMDVNENKNIAVVVGNKITIPANKW